MEALEREKHFARMMAGLSAELGEKQIVMNEELSAIGPRTMTNATYLKAHQTATSMAAKVSKARQQSGGLLS